MSRLNGQNTSFIQWSIAHASSSSSPWSSSSSSPWSSTADHCECLAGWPRGVHVHRDQPSWEGQLVEIFHILALFRNMRRGLCILALYYFEKWEQVSANFTITVETTTLAGVHQGVKTILNFVNFVNISRFFFFTAFSTRGGGCDPRNNQPLTWSSPPCPRSSPKVAQLLDSHAHQQLNPLLYYI